MHCIQTAFIFGHSTEGKVSTELRILAATRGLIDNMIQLMSINPQPRAFQQMVRVPLVVICELSSS